MAHDSHCPRVQDLITRGVRVIQPATVWVSDEVNPAAVAPDAVIHPGCRISGAQTSIGPRSEIGEEAPVTLMDCQLGSSVALKGGYFSGAVFLDGAHAGSGAHVRPGTVVEEEASLAHTVGLKQTLLMPFVTLGSLINFCDCLMAGGTSRKNHSEVGSSYIHFNFTPHQDKATASLLGDVPRGVMLNQAPIFLGGQGGLVGPVRIGFGCTIPAGIVWRRDAPADGMLLHLPPSTAAGPRPYRAGVYRGALRIFRNNLHYLGQVRALREWYRHARAPFMRGHYHHACWEGALRQLDAVLAERDKRLHEFMAKLKASANSLRASGDTAAQREAAQQDRLVASWPAAADVLARGIDAAGHRERDQFLRGWIAQSSQSYLQTIIALDPALRAAGTAWLQAVVDITAASGQGMEGD